jgi:sulfonate transport system substrate-binding protein
LNRRRKLLAFSAIALTGLAATACSSSSSSSSTPAATAAAASGSASASSGASASSSASPSSSVNLSSVTLNVGDQKGTGAEAVLKAAGLLNTLPFHVSWSDFTSGPPMLEAMASGSVDVGGVGDAPPVFAAAGGEGVVIVGARTVPSGDQDALVVPKGSPITSIQQLKGKKIAYGSGSSGNYHLLTVLTAAGLTTKDVTLVNLQPADALAAFTSGSVDAWDIWPPYVQQVVAQDGAKVLARGSQYGSPYSYEVASKSAVANPEKAAAIEVYLATLDKAYVWAEKNPDAWGTAWAAATGLPASITDVAATVDSTTPVAVDGAVTTSEQGLVTQFFKAGLIPSAPNMSGFITSQFNSSVSGG